VSVAVFVLTGWLTRIVSLASLVASGALPPLAYILGSPPAVVIAGSLVAAVILIRHRTNVVRLRRGVERRLGQ
jgi:glycerol-3-phosphate acyltransferase PlsY